MTRARIFCVLLLGLCACSGSVNESFDEGQYWRYEGTTLLPERFGVRGSREFGMVTRVVKPETINEKSYITTISFPEGVPGVEPERYHFRVAGKSVYVLAADGKTEFERPRTLFSGAQWTTKDNKACTAEEQEDLHLKLRTFEQVWRVVCTDDESSTVMHAQGMALLKSKTVLDDGTEIEVVLAESGVLDP